MLAWLGSKYLGAKYAQPWQIAKQTINAAVLSSLEHERAVKADLS